MSEDEWNTTPWHAQRAYLEGLEQDDGVPFEFSHDSPDSLPFTVRESVDAGTDVIDLAAMRAELESGRRKGGGG